VIQSEAAGISRSSAVGPEPPSPPGEAVAAASPADGFAFEPSPPESRESRFDALLLLVRRSTFAQPEPLNTTVGGANALRTGPPAQLGQVSGPWPCTPWTTFEPVMHAAQA
jgi:hypothetical protein